MRSRFCVSGISRPTGTAGSSQTFRSMIYANLSKHTLQPNPMTTPNNEPDTARTAAEAEFRDQANWIPGHERPSPVGYHVQQLLDTTTAALHREVEDERKAHAEMARRYEDMLLARGREVEELRAQFEKARQWNQLCELE